MPHTIPSISNLRIWLTILILQHFTFDYIITQNDK